jgi:hypothetical protein
MCGIEGIDKIMQSRYRSGVEILLYLIKHSLTDISNVVREHSKCMGSTNMTAYRDMFSLTKIVMDIKSICINIMPKDDETN